MSTSTLDEKGGASHSCAVTTASMLRSRSSAPASCFNHIYRLFCHTKWLRNAPPRFLPSCDGAEGQYTGNYVLTTGKSGTGYYLLESEIAASRSKVVGFANSLNLLINHPMRCAYRGALLQLIGPMQPENAATLLPVANAPWDSPAILRLRLLKAAAASDKRALQSVILTLKGLRDRCWQLPSIRTAVVMCIAELVAFNPMCAEGAASLLSGCPVNGVEAVLNAVSTLQMRERSPEDLPDSPTEIMEKSFSALRGVPAAPSPLQHRTLPPRAARRNAPYAQRTGAVLPHSHPCLRGS